MHALSARPLKVHGGRESSVCADESRDFCQPSPAGEGVARSVTDEVLLQYIAKENLISLCSHQDTHPNSNREVRHSPTWHSSESESALKRFEPVAVVMLQSDGRGTLFAPVAARRQGEIYKRGERSLI